MRVKIDRTFGFEIYFIVDKWNDAYRKFNERFCDVSRSISLAIVDSGFYYNHIGLTRRMPR